MILLDTNAVLWMQGNHAKARSLGRWAGRLYLSPATLLELQFLLECGRIRAKSSVHVSEIVDDDRWVLDDPPSAPWFRSALDVSWTRDPFDRLLVAHALYRGWRFATGDTVIVQKLGADRCIEL